MLNVVTRYAFVALLFQMSCAEAQPPIPGPPPALDARRMRQTCPLGVDNAHVTFDETARGATIVFSTTPEHLHELRNRVRNASERHGTGKHTGEGHHGKHGVGAGQHGLQPYYFPPAQVTIDTTADGARLTFTPDKVDDLDALRNVLRYRVERMMSHCG